ncbi:MAG: hypothetical protein LIO94_02445 [Clostridiales bacterium]|nr:hypothetical protein [Clostridiales bacterium]MCC8113085.1 hypothetical protein [Bacteroidales bacterium]
MEYIDEPPYYEPPFDDGPVYDLPDPPNLDKLKDPGYTGGEVILYGSRPEDKDEELDKFLEDLSNPYNQSYSVPNSDISTSIYSNGDINAGYIPSSDFDFDSWVDSYSGDGSISVTNSNGDQWNGNVGSLPTLDTSSYDAMTAYFLAAQEAQQNLIVEWGTSIPGIIQELAWADAMALARQKALFNANSEQLKALLGNNAPAVQQEIQALQNQLSKNT